MGELTHVIVGPGDERVWMDEVGAGGAVIVNFRVGQYPGEYHGDPMDGKPTIVMSVHIDETKKPNYAVRIPEYASRGLAYVMLHSMPETGLQPDEFDLVSRIISESIMTDAPDKGSEFGMLLMHKTKLPKLSVEDLAVIKAKIENWKPKYDGDACE